MKMRIPVAVLVALALFLSACGDDGDSALDQVRDDNSAQDAGDDVTRDDDKDDKDDSAADDTDDDDDRDGGSVLDDIADDDDDDSSGLGSLPNMENLGDCFTISMTYATIGLASLGGVFGGAELSDSDRKELQKSIEQLRGQLPKEIQGDFEVVADAYGVVMKEGFMSSAATKALESDKFTKANERIEKYIDELCG